MTLQDFPPVEPRLEPRRAAEHAHAVQFNESESVPVGCRRRFLAAGLTVGEPLVVISTAPHRASFQSSLTTRGVDVDDALAGGQLAWLDAEETLSTFMIGERPDAGRFKRSLGRVFESTRNGPTRRRR